MNDQPFRLDRDRARMMGVCAGLTATTGIDLTLVRVLTAALALCFPVVILAYLVAGFVAPR